LLLVKRTLIFKKFALILGAPGRFSGEGHLRVAQVKRMNHILYFSGIDIVCLQQTELL
jgi:hypothetical protein